MNARLVGEVIRLTGEMIRLAGGMIRLTRGLIRLTCAECEPVKECQKFCEEECPPTEINDIYEVFNTKLESGNALEADVEEAKRDLQESLEAAGRTFARFSPGLDVIISMPVGLT